MKLTFLGTRGYIDARTRLHRRHACLRVGYRGASAVVDWGEDWAGEAGRVRPRAIVITHAHPDHAGGLAAGAPCPVWATEEAWEDLERHDVPERHRIVPRESFETRGIRFEAFPVEHSTRCPTVGYRITAGRVSVFYAPDVVYIHDRAVALGGCRAYVGDGSTLRQSFVRRRGERLIGHAPVWTQLGWCGKEGVPRALISHCGSEIVEGDERSLGPEVRRMGEERGIEAEIATDGLEVILR